MSAPPLLHAGLRFTRASGLAMAHAAYAAGVEARNKADALLEQLHDEMTAAPASPLLELLGEACELLAHEAEQFHAVIELLGAIVEASSASSAQRPGFVPLPCRPKAKRRRRRISRTTGSAAPAG